MSTPAIEVVNVERTLGAFHLGPISFSVPLGTVCGLIGANGAGKTSTLDVLMGMGKPNAGSIRMLGLDISTHEAEIKRRTAYVGPDLSYQAWGRVGDAIAFVSGFYPDWSDDRCRRLQSEFGLSAEQRIASLSFGERIKLSLLMALSREAQLLLLDEPTVGLDPVSRRQLFRELLAFMQQENRSILISSHQLNDLERFADEIILLKQGRIVVHDRTDQLSERFRHVVVRATETFKGIPGFHVVRAGGGRTELLVDLTKAQVQTLQKLGHEILHEASLSLEDLFLLLSTIDPENGLRRAAA
ncbi:MAG TPA: ABC transporter ATP-binding protein [Steroidobacteraceae bacterium]